MAVKNREKAVAFIVARLNSSRLAGKHFKKIGPKTILEWIIDELKRSKEIEEIVVATVAEPANEPLKRWCKQVDIQCFWYLGNVDHVTTRLRKAAEEFGADLCVLISGDCPLIYAPSIDQLIRQLRRRPDADLIRVSPNSEGFKPALQGISVARKHAWHLADDLSTRPELKEHQFPIFNIMPDRFRFADVEFNGPYDPFNHRYSVDTWADIEFMRALYEGLNNKKLDFNLLNAIDYLNEHKELLEINRHVHQMAVAEKSKRVLMIVDAGNGYGYGHLMRSRELALQVIERLGWPVIFSVNDPLARQILSEVGIKTIDYYPEIKSIKKDDSLKVSNGLPRVISSKSSHDFDLVLLDIYCQDHLPKGWRDRYFKKSKVVVIDRIEPWSMEADLIVIPGITYNDIDSMKIKSNIHKIMYGLDYVIIRREVKKAKNKETSKDLDFVAYLHLEWQKEKIRNLLNKNRYKISGRVVNGFSKDFETLLARSFSLISGFGYSFYESLFLKCLPITWPLSDFHEKDAELFYKRIDLKPFIIGNSISLYETVSNISSLYKKIELPAIKDGTCNIVASIASI